MIQSIRKPLVVAALCVVSFSNVAWSQQGFDLINDLDLLVPASAKDFDQMLDVDIDDGDAVEIDQVEATFVAVERSRRLLDLYKPHFEDIRERELRFLHAVVDLKRSEFDAIDGVLNLEIRKAYLEAVQNAVNRQDNVNAGWELHNFALGIFAETQQLHDRLLQLVEDHVAFKRAALYVEEINARRDFEKDAVIESITANIALKFVLSISQREQVEQLVRGHWQEAWREDAQDLINYGVGCIREFPKERLSEILRTSQKVFFDSIQWERKRRARIPKIMRRKPRDQSLVDGLNFAAEDEEQK